MSLGCASHDMPAVVSSLNQRAPGNDDVAPRTPPPTTANKRGWIHINDDDFSFESATKSRHKSPTHVSAPHSPDMRLECALPSSSGSRDISSSCSPEALAQSSPLKAEGVSAAALWDVTVRWSPGGGEEPKEVRRSSGQNKFTHEEDVAIREGVDEFGEGKWKQVRNKYPKILGNRSTDVIRARHQRLKKKTIVDTNMSRGEPGGESGFGPCALPRKELHAERPVRGVPNKLSSWNVDDGLGRLDLQYEGAEVDQLLNLPSSKGTCYLSGTVMKLDVVKKTIVMKYTDPSNEAPIPIGIGQVRCKPAAPPNLVAEGTVKGLIPRCGELVELYFDPDDPESSSSCEGDERHDHPAGWWDAHILEVCEEGKAFIVGVSGTSAVHHRVKAARLRPRWFYSNAARLFVYLLDGMVWCAPARATSLQPMQSPVLGYAPTDHLVEAFHKIDAWQEELQNMAEEVQAATHAVDSARKGRQEASDALEAAKRCEAGTSHEVRAVENEMDAINCPGQTEIRLDQNIAMQASKAVTEMLALHTRKSAAERNQKKAKEDVSAAATSLRDKEALLSQAEADATALESKHHEIVTKLTNHRSLKAQEEAIRLQWLEARQ
ncbi:MAG: hypothetical protein SGPRY_011393 [Prymnesium sp.]